MTEHVGCARHCAKCSERGISFSPHHDTTGEGCDYYPEFIPEKAEAQRLVTWPASDSQEGVEPGLERRPV